MSKKDDGSNPVGSNLQQNREAWFAAGLNMLRPTFKDRGHDLPPKIRMSIGFTSTGRKGKVGEAWRAEKSAGGFVELFVRPDFEDSLEILTILVALLVTSMVPDGADFAQRYKTVAAEIGLRGSRREPHCAPALRDRLNEIAKTIGPIPHSKLDIGLLEVGAPKKQTVRQLLAECPMCGVKIRLTQQAIDTLGGLPICPKHTVPFKQPGKETSATSEPAPAAVVPRLLTAAQRELAIIDRDAPDTAASVTSTWMTRFPKPPAREITEQLKGFGGRYNAEHKHWAGTSNSAAVQAVVVAAGGQFELIEDDHARAG